MDFLHIPYLCEKVTENVPAACYNEGAKEYKRTGSKRNKGCSLTPAIDTGKENYHEIKG